jgi:hypothetical protein
MDDKQMQILKLLESGKITADDAVRLIDALNKPVNKSSSASDKISSLADSVCGYVKEYSPVVKEHATKAAHKAGDLLDGFINTVKERRSSHVSERDYDNTVKVTPVEDEFDTVGEAVEDEYTEPTPVNATAFAEPESEDIKDIILDDEPATAEPDPVSAEGATEPELAEPKESAEEITNK